MMQKDTAAFLRSFEIQPSLQRLGIAQYILNSQKHPSAEMVWKKVRRRFPTISLATVYNTLHLFVEKGLLREVHLTADGVVVYDPNLERHHHFIDERTGKIYDIPWSRVRVEAGRLRGFQVRDYQVVMRGRRKAAKKSRAKGKSTLRRSARGV